MQMLLKLTLDKLSHLDSTQSFPLPSSLEKVLQSSIHGFMG